MTIKAKPGWAWWSGSDEEFFTNGPFRTREGAVEALDGEGGFVCHAMSDSVRFSADRLIEAQYFENEDYFDGEHGEPDRLGGEEVVAQADAELQALIDQWADKWQHTFVRPETFAASGGAESVPVDYTDDGELSEEEEVELLALEGRPQNEMMYHERERCHYLRERKAFFEGVEA